MRSGSGPKFCLSIELRTTSGRPVLGALTLSLMDAGQPAGVAILEGGRSFALSL